MPADLHSLPPLDSDPPGGVNSSRPAADTDLPDIVTDLGAEPPGGAHEVALLPTLSHIGRYAIKRPLGAGGLGEVHEAWDPLLSRVVAVKTIQLGLSGPQRLSLDGLFLNEARAAAGLSHRHIVTVHDAGLSAHGVYIAMERLRGRDLQQALREDWRPTVDESALLARRLADALAYAHARGVVHNDIKPANVFLTRRGRPKLLDFGLAQIAQRAAPAEPMPAPAPCSRGVAGSPHYLSPEQLRGAPGGPQSDVYALGVVLYELLTGIKPFDGSSLGGIVEAVLHGQPRAPHVLRSKMPHELSAITMRAMAREPAARFSSAESMARALRRFIDVQPVAAAPVAAAPGLKARLRNWLRTLGPARRRRPAPGGNSGGSSRRA